jgi:SAM-dependent methyltransferase
LDFSFAGARTLSPSWKGRAQDNIEAIRHLNLLDREHRPAMPGEQAAIARFVGFGASELANNIFADRTGGSREGWEDLGQSLIAETTERELQSLKRATQYAHYTPEYIVRAMWDAARVLGFSGGQILEPGCGSGLFMGFRPDDLSDDTVFVGIENDPVTARVANALYPNQVIRCIDFDKATLPADFDLAIGNPPFSNLTIHNKSQLGRLGLSLHDFFIARALEQLRPGGIALFVTSRYSLDKSDPKARLHMESIADFLGAVRLPSKAMKEEAGTDVVVDILLFRKRAPDAPFAVRNWIELAEIPTATKASGRSGSTATSSTIPIMCSGSINGAAANSAWNTPARPNPVSSWKPRSRPPCRRSHRDMKAPTARSIARHRCATGWMSPRTWKSAQRPTKLTSRKAAISFCAASSTRSSTEFPPKSA